MTEVATTRADAKVDPVREPAMSSGWMVDTLGFFSSHPCRSGRRLLLWYTVAFFPIVAAAGCFAWWASADGLLDAMELVFRHGRIVLLYGMAAAGFAVGLGLTAALAARASRSPVLVADSGHPALGTVWILSILVGLGTLPWLIPLLCGVDARTRTYFALLGVLPLVLIVAIVSFMPTEDAEGRPIKHGFRWWTLIFPGLVVGVGLASQVSRFSAWIESLGPVDRLLRTVSEAAPSLQGTFVPSVEGLNGWLVTSLVVIVTAPFLCAAIIAMAFLRDAAVGDSQERRLKARPPVEKRVRRRSLLGEGRDSPRRRRRALGLGADPELDQAGLTAAQEPDDGSDPDGTEADPPPEWVAKLKTSVDPSGKWGDWIPKRFEPGETSPRYEGEDRLDEYFAGVGPSRDQVHAFATIYDRFTGVEKESQTKPVWEVGTADVLLEGGAGSGRTAVAVASIVQSVVVRGHTVLVLVPSAGKRASIMRRIQKAARSSGVGWYMNIGDLTPEGVRIWAEPGKSNPPTVQAATPGDHPESLSEVAQRQEAEQRQEDLQRSIMAPEATPDVLVGTLAEFETAFFAGAANFDRLRAVVTRLEMVVVEDLDLFAVRERVHLPFVLDKIRLLVSSEGRRCQTVVVSTELADAGREFLQQRLLSAAKDTEAVRLRPFSPSSGRREPWQVSLHAVRPGPRGVTEVIEACARACVQAGTEVIVHSPCMSLAERGELRAGIAAAGPAAVRVVADLDELDLAEGERLGAVFHAARDGLGASLSIRGHAGSTDVVVFNVLPARLGRLEEPARETIMAIPDGRSRSLFSMHLASASRFLRRLRPIHRQVVSKMGLDRVGGLADFQYETSEGAVSRRYGDRKFLVDPPDSIAAARPGGPWSWVTLGRGEPGENTPLPAPVDLTAMLDPSASIEIDAGGTAFLPIRRDPGQPGLSGQAERRVAEWDSGDRQAVGRDDLAYAAHLRFETGDASFYPARIEEPDGHDRGSIRIEGALWSERTGASSQPYLVAWQVDEYSVGEAFLPKRNNLSCLSGRFRLMEVAIDRDRIRALAESAPGTEPSRERATMTQFLGLRLAATFDELGDAQAQAISIRYQASSCLLPIGFKEEELEPVRLRTLLLDGWPDPARRQVLPELGIALTFAMRRHVPGLDRLVRCIGVRVPVDGGSSRIAAILVEPTSTERTAFGLLQWVTRSPLLTAEFFSTAARCLEDYRDGKGGIGTLLTRGHGCLLANRGSIEFVPEDDSVAEVASTLRGIADAAAEKARLTT